jgi:stage III sporulation protein AE
MKCKIILLLMILLYFGSNKVYAEQPNTINDAIEQMDTNDLQNYMDSNSSYFREKNINIKTLIENAFKGRLDIDIKDYLIFQLNEERDFFRNILKTCIHVLVICMILTIINYFSDELGKQSVSDIVILFSVMIIFTIILKDVLHIKNIMQQDFIKYKIVTEEINGLFLAAMLTFGKLSLLQFFQTSLNYTIGITTKLIYNFADIMTVLMIALILINNTSKLFNAKLFYDFSKKGTLLILSGYITIVVIIFSLQGYILYKTDNIFISSIKALSPSAIPVVGKAVTSFFGVFLKSVLMIKDVLGIVVILFILSAFGGSLIKILIILMLYKLTSVLIEPFNEKMSKFIYEMADIFYIYLICMITPIIIVTVYYSILLNYMNNIFG